MFDPDTAMLSNCFFFYSIPDGLRDWCKEPKIQGRIFEIYDGGGPTGHVIEFEDADTRDRVAENFIKEDPRQQCLLGEAIHLLGWL